MLTTEAARAKRDVERVVGRRLPNPPDDLVAFRKAMDAERLDSLVCTVDGVVELAEFMQTPRFSEAMRATRRSGVLDGGTSFVWRRRYAKRGSFDDAIGSLVSG